MLTAGSSLSGDMHATRPAKSDENDRMPNISATILTPMANNLPIPYATDNAQNSDTLSEVSETTTSASGWDTKDELKNFVTRLGCSDLSELYQERFRIDRKKLEQMLVGDSEAPSPADVFFEQVMSDTDTYISWPNKLKIGGRSKKDPYVRIAGRQKDVLSAKERIVAILNTRSNRVTMKMEVCYTDHSHIIGKGGQTIKRVMAETKCHVHFPDSNRTNPTEKSNQVSISGDIQGVESARSRVRELVPLIFGFELPVMSNNINPSNPYILKVEEQYKVQVTLKIRPKLHATLVLVKGVEWELEKVKSATLTLMEYLCQNLAGQTLVHMTMEISPHHHPLVTGKNHSNLKVIMQCTNCRIILPDAQDPNIAVLKKSNVSIAGNIHDVYRARQMLTGCLPVSVVFDLPEDLDEIRAQPQYLSEIENSYDLLISIRQKMKMSTKTCVIKSVERNLGNIYKARNMILNVNSPPVVANIPPTYQLPNIQLQSPMGGHHLSPLTLNPTPISPLMSPMISPTWPYPLTPFLPNTPSLVGIIKPPQQFTFAPSHDTMGSSGYQSAGQMTSSSPSMGQMGGGYSPLSSIATASTAGSSPSNVSHSDTSSSSVISSILSNISTGNYHGPSVDKRQDAVYLTPSDYEQKRISGIKAMKEHLSGGNRTPNSAWVGYGISHTSPADMENHKQRLQDGQEWKCVTPVKENVPSTSTGINTSNFLDHMPAHTVNRFTNTDWTDLSSLLVSVGLEKYVSLFMSHEIDLSTFPSLSDKDLLEMGITAIGARRKILLVITEFNRRSFDRAPGAERKPSPSGPRTKW